LVIVFLSKEEILFIMPRPIIPAVILALALFASLSSGCGGGGEETLSKKEVPLSKGEFIKQADAICAQMDARVVARLKNFARTHPAIEQGPSAKGPTTAFVTSIVLPEIQQQAEDIEALPAPAGDEEKIEEIVSEIEAGVEETAQGDVTRIFTNDRGRFQQVYKLGTAYGFKVCNEAL
jgi:hypothetical protein